MTTQSEILEIARLVAQINETPTAPPVHLMIGPRDVCVTTFTDKGRVDWQKNIYEFIGDYLADLRFLRHELEQMRDLAVSQGQERAA